MPVFGVDGKVLLHKGVRVTSSYINALRKKGVNTLFIEDKHTTDINPKPIISAQVRQQAVRSVHQNVKKIITDDVIKGKVSSQDLGKEYQKVFKEILDHLLASDNLLFNLSDLFISKGYFYHHSVNVAVLAGIIGIAKGYSSQQLIDLGVGALLFDIGMTQIPEEILGQSGQLTIEEKQILESHTLIGYEMLKSQPNISLFSAHCALQHHERYDGGGYPLQRKRQEIHEYSRIVAIADVYDALTSSRNHRKQHSAQEAAEYLSAAGGSIFDFDLVKLFLRHIAIYPVSSTVKLNTGQIGVVSKLYSDTPLRPVVRIISEPNGEEVKNTYEIDLRKEISLTIVESIL
jgi:HD-GYP domain-containing protein (c-di-GMP phosphodiesterase class II)